MSLIDFMQDLVANPPKLMRYKRNPAAYLEREGTALSSDEKNLLLQFYRPLRLELSNVMSLRVEILSGSSLRDAESINLRGLEVKLLSRAQIFLAEFPEGVTGDELPYYLLPHSTFYFDKDAREGAKVNFDLRICYVDPLNDHDTAQVLNIKTKDYNQAANNQYLKSAEVYFHIDQDNYVLLRADEEQMSILQEGSILDLSKQTLILVFNGFERPE